MIPTLGLIVGTYCCIRCLELLLSAGSRYASEGAGVVVKLAAVLGGAVIAFATLALMASGGK